MGFGLLLTLGKNFLFGGGFAKLIEAAVRFFTSPPGIAALFVIVFFVGKFLGGREERQACDLRVTQMVEDSRRAAETVDKSAQEAALKQALTDAAANADLARYWEDRAAEAEREKAEQDAKQTQPGAAKSCDDGRITPDDVRRFGGVPARKK